MNGALREYECRNYTRRGEECRENNSRIATISPPLENLYGCTPLPR